MAMANFLPTDYKAPTAGGGYMKIQEGENRIRILSAPVVGWEDWTQNKKPVRFRLNEKPKAPIDPEKAIKHFWALIVWNYTEARIQILQITQSTVRNPIENLAKDADWGAPYFYDLKIIKTKVADKTSYSVIALPHKPVAEHIKEAFYEERINLNALFDGEDPFASSYDPTDGVFDADESCAAVGIDRETLRRRFDMCPQAFKDKIGDFLIKNALKADFSDIKEELLERIDKKINSELTPKPVEKS